MLDDEGTVMRLRLLASAIMCGALAVAYPLSRHKMRFNRPFLLTILFSTGLPGTTLWHVVLPLMWPGVSVVAMAA